MIYVFGAAKGMVIIMSQIRLNIDGRECIGYEGQTVLEIALENGIEIPTLCNDERVKMYGSCGICAVEEENSPKLLRACSTYAADAMIIKTNTARVSASRRTALELLLSDHTGDCRPPCVLACPAQTDCQGYVGLIANGEYEQALELIKDRIPLPASIGRVCPHPCEEACRRTMVEEPISIAALKQFAGDMDLQNGSVYTIDVGEPTGKHVAVVGGGPGGLTAAYFLRGMGHEVTIYDAMPLMGGMLRYGIPEYRLPKKLLQEEIDAVENMGVTFINNTNIGRDVTLEYLQREFNAVVVAVGAWSSAAVHCPGETLTGVLGGIDFLRDTALNQPLFINRKIAVVGGGNTAMDCARTAIRLGAEKVYNIYRRTKNEMPAEEIEIVEAEEEGVIFKNLTNPIEIVGEEGQVKSIRLQIMELGQPDTSGRRAPVAVEGKEESLDVDTVIVAIGQKPAPQGLESIEMTKQSTIAADETTFRTNLEGVFAIGDATNKGADIAIAAIGEAKKAAFMVDKYLSGEELGYKAPFIVESVKTTEDFADIEKASRAKMSCRSADERRNDFLPVSVTLTEEEAHREASRCLECGCHDFFECKLIQYANQYEVNPGRYTGQTHNRTQNDTHPFIHRNPDKCILCGLCVRVCDEVVGATALGLVDRGFNAIVRPALDMDLNDTDCIGCGQCVDVCPTGALTETMMLRKQVPVQEEMTESVCSFCSVGCKSIMTSLGSSLIRNLPYADRMEDALLCAKGRFGFGEINREERLTVPMIRRGNAFEKVDFEQAIVYTNKRLQALQTQYGADCIAVAVSDRYTNEEAQIIKSYANSAMKTQKVFSFGRVESGLLPVFGKDASTAALDELAGTELIMLIGCNLMNNHAVAGMKVRRAVNNGAKLLIIGGTDELLDEIATLKLDAEFDTLKQMTKALLSSRREDIDNRKALEEYCADAVITDAAQNAADMYMKAKKAIVIFEKNALGRDAALLAADMALLSNHSGKPRDGIIQLLPGANSQGLSYLGIATGESCRAQIANGEIKGLFIFGEDVPDVDLSGLDFLAVQDLHMTKTAEKAHVVFPAASFAETAGSFTSADGRIQQFAQVIQAKTMRNDEQVIALATQAGERICSCVCTEKANAVFKPQGGCLAVPQNTVLLSEAVFNTNELQVQFMTRVTK